MFPGISGIMIFTMAVGLSQLCSGFDLLCYSIMLHFLINYASKCTNYASYNYDQLFSHKDCQFYKVQFKNAVENKGGKSHKLSVVVNSILQHN